MDQLDFHSQGLEGLMMKGRKVVILGGGFSGLWLAAQLLKRRYEVEVLEKEREVGGLLQTVHYENFSLDLGPHIYFSPYRHYYEEFTKEPLRLLHAHYGFALHGGQVRSPITPKNIWEALTPREIGRLSLNFLQTRIRLTPQKSVQTAEEWCTRRYGRLAYSYFFKDYIPKVMGIPADHVSSDWGSERERFYREHNLWQQSLRFLGSLIRGVGKKENTLELYYLPKGSNQISEGLYHFIKEHGGTIRTRASLRKICLGNDRQLTTVIFLQDEKEEETKGDYVVNTLPLTTFIQSVQPAPDSVLQAAHSLRFRHLWLFYFIISRPFLSDKLQIYFPEKHYLFKRVYEAHPINETSSDRTAICVEMCYSDGDSISQMSEEELSLLLQKQLAQYYGLQSHEWIAAFSKRAPSAYAVYEKGYREHLLTIASFLLNIDSLISYGRSGLFRYNFLTDRIIDASKSVLQYIMTEQGKKEFLQEVQPKGDFL